MTRLAPNVVASLATAVALIGTALASVPLILDDVGLAGYGVWTIGLTLLLYVTTAEAGLGPAVQRFVAVAAGAGEHTAVRRLLWSSLALYALLGALLAGLAVLVAAPLVDAFDVPGALREDAEAMFAIVGLAVAAALLVAALGNVMQGLERFTAFAASAAVASVAYLVALVVLLAAGEGLSGLAWAAVIQQVAMLAFRAVALRDVLRAPGLVAWQEIREIVRFSLRLQVTVLSTLVNTQTDKVVVGVVASPATLGQLGIGAQVAEAGRLVSGAALSPVISRLSAVHGADDPAALRALFARLHGIWLAAVTGGTLIGGAVLYPLIDGWLGDGHGEAAALGAFLVLAYGLGLLSGTGVAYLRAVGRPGLEARYGVVLIVSNVVLTVGLGIAFGAYGVVAATAAAYVAGTAWFFARLRAAAPELAGVSLLPRPQVLFVGAVAAATAAGFGLAAIAVLPRWWALVPVLVVAAAAFASFMRVVTGGRAALEALRA